MEEYYAQRARPVLIVSEATVVAPEGNGYPHTPGIFTEEQIAGWKPIVSASKRKGATFLCQLWHGGRASHPEYQPDGKDPIGPSAVAINSNDQVFLPKSLKMADYPVPRALPLSEIPEIVQQFADGAKNALAAGYLIDQFLKQSANKRTDDYGGSIENRCRFVLEVVEAVVNAVGAERVGLRLSPYSWEFLNAREPDVESTIKLNVHLLEQLNKHGLLYVHIVASRAEDYAADSGAPSEEHEGKAQTLEPFRKAFKGPLIAAGGYLEDSAAEEIESGNADLVAFGRWWLANPDLPDRFQNGSPLNKYIRDTFYTHDPVIGYTDYPYLKDIAKDTPVSKHYSGADVFDL